MSKTDTLGKLAHEIDGHAALLGRDVQARDVGVRELLDRAGAQAP